MKTEQQLAQELLSIIKKTRSQYQVVGNKLIISSNGRKIDLPMFLGNTVSEKVVLYR